MALLASIPCYVLLLVPAVFVNEAHTSLSRSAFPTINTFLVLMPIQVIAQAVATWRFAIPELGDSRMRLLRVLAVVRISIFVAAALTVTVTSLAYDWNLSGLWDGPIGSQFGFMLLCGLYFFLPLCAVASDIILSRVLLALQRESQLTLSRWQTISGSIARVLLWLVFPFILAPFVGWFFAPIIWTIAMGRCFGETRAMARCAQ